MAGPENLNQDFAGSSTGRRPVDAPDLITNGTGFTKAVARVLSTNGTTCCALSRWAENCEVPAVDVLISTSDHDNALASMAAGMRQQGYAPIQWIRDSGFTRIRFTTRTDDFRISELRVYSRRSLLIPHPERILQGACADMQEVGAAEEFAFLLRSALFRDEVPQGLLHRIEALTDNIPLQIRLAVSNELLGVSPEAVSLSERGLAQDALQLKRLGRKAYLRAAVRNPLLVPSHAARHVANRFASWREFEGLQIVFLGPDGAGKSTLKREVLARLQALFTKTWLCHWRPGMLWKVGPATPFRRPHAVRPRGVLASMIYLTAVFADYWIGYLFRGRALIASSGLVSSDRFFPDVIVDPIRYRYTGPRWFATMLLRLVPRHDLMIILDADEHIMFARKPEVPVETLREYRKRYAELRRELPRTVLVRNDFDLDASVRTVLTSVFSHLEQRFNRRHGLDGAQTIHHDPGMSRNARSVN